MPEGDHVLPKDCSGFRHADYMPVKLVKLVKLVSANNVCNNNLCKSFLSQCRSQWHKALGSEFPVQSLRQHQCADVGCQQGLQIT